MNVWIRKTKRRAQCKYCEKFLEVGEWQVVCQYFMKLKTGRTWVKKMVFHAKEPNCWLDRAVAEIESRVVVETRGRKRAAISDEDREVRERILRRRASVMQRLRVEMDGAVRPEKIARLTELIEVCAVEIMPYGGVPRAWGTSNREEEHNES